MKTSKFRDIFTLLEVLLLCWRANADSTPPPLPPEVAINREAGRGGLLIVTLWLEGEELPFIIDTGSPITFLAKSLEPKLGKRLLTMGAWNFGAEQDSGIYAAPRLWLRNTRLMTDTYMGTYDFKRLSFYCGRPIMGILGLDCLRHYCVQLDFTAGKLRFLDSGHVDASELGNAFPLTFSSEGQNPPPIFPAANQIPSSIIIHHAGLLGGADTNLLIDTGDNVDGSVENSAFKGRFGTRLIHFFFRRRALRLKECVWDGKTYTNLRVGRGKYDCRLGLRFLARHLVTFDFPKGIMYLQQIRTGPLAL